MSILNVEFEILLHQVSISKSIVSIEKEKSLQLKVIIPNAFESCILNKHIREITFRFTTEFDEEAKINEEGYWFPPNLAQFLIKNVETYFEDCLIDSFCFELACEITKENLEKTAKDYDYSESDVRGFFDSPRHLAEHYICCFRGKQRALPKCKHKRQQLLQKYKEESLQLDFDDEKFWNDYTWSQLKQEKMQMLKTIRVTTVTTPNSLVYKTLDFADYKRHKKPADGKIHRQMDIYIDRCRLCYIGSDHEFKPEKDCNLPNLVSFLVTFRMLSELTIKKN